MKIKHLSSHPRANEMHSKTTEADGDLEKNRKKRKQTFNGSIQLTLL